MDEDLVRKKPKGLNKRQAHFVAAREAGQSPKQSAIFAGYSGTDKSGEHVEQTAIVQQELQKARLALARDLGITKDDVLEGLRTAANMAHSMADPMAMVRAWSEIGKMLGHYAPVKHQHEHGLNKESREAMKALSDDDLHKLANGRVIEGEFVEVKDGGKDSPALPNLQPEEEL